MSIVQGVLVYLPGKSTPERHSSAAKFWVEKDGHLHLSNEQVGLVAVYAPGSWRSAQLAPQPS